MTVTDLSTTATPTVSTMPDPIVSTPTMFPGTVSTPIGFAATDPVTDPTTTGPSLGSVDDPVLAVLDSIGAWHPDAQSATLRDAADAWQAMATALTSLESSLETAAQPVSTTNDGQAATLFAGYWQTWTSDTGYFPVSADACGRMADALDGYADAVDRINSDLADAVDLATNTPTGSMVTTGVVAGSAAAQELVDLAESLQTSLSQSATALLASSGVTATQAISPATPATTTASTATLTATDNSFAVSSLDFSGLDNAAVDLMPSSSSSADPGATPSDPSGYPTALGAAGASAAAILAADQLSAAASPGTAALTTPPLPADPDAGPTDPDPDIPTSGPSTLDTSGLAGITVPPPAAVPTDSLTSGADPIPTMTPSTLTSATTGLAAAGAAGLAGGAARAVKSASSSSDMPFIPMGGMGGAGGGGDDANDEGPTRRRLR
jgi:hypothetical protein